MRNGWVETSLGEITEVVGGGTPSTKIGEYWDGDIVWLTPTEITSQDGKVVSDSIRKITDLGFKNSGAQMLPINSVILTSRASVGFVALSGKELCTNQGFQSLIPKPSVLSKFIMFWIQQNRSEFESRSAGSTFKEISKSNVKSIKILLPPLPEQKRIVDLISSVDAYVEALQQQLESAKRSRNAVLHKLLTEGGDDWVETTLDRVTECSWGNTETTKSKYVESGFLAYSASGADGFLDWFEHDRTAVVLSAIGAQCGKTWFAEGKWTSIKNTIWLKSDNSNLLDKYLYYLSNTDQFWQIRGQAQPFISLGDVKKTRVLLPPLRDQERIVEVISEMDAFIESIQRTSMEAKNLRSGLLSDLLSGSHEIPTTYDKVMGAA